MTHISFIEDEDLQYSVGLLGATTTSPACADAVRINVIERRILRIEMALRQAGIEVEHLDLPA